MKNLNEQYRNIQYKIEILKFKKKRKSLMLNRIITMSACLLIIVSVILTSKQINDNGKIPFDNSGRLYGENILISTKIPYPAVKSGGVNLSIPNTAPLRFEFYIDKPNSFVFRAKAIRVLPDIYYSLHTLYSNRINKYYVFEMEIIDVIAGEKIQGSFYYLLPKNYYADLTDYDELILSVCQVGVQNITLVNSSTNMLTSFPFVFTASREAGRGDVIAFNNGIFTKKLWSSKSWYEGEQYVTDDRLLVQEGASIKYVTESINILLNKINYTGSILRTYNFNSEEAKTAMEYVSPYKNGVFLGDNVFYRYINGCLTNEWVSITDEKVIYSEHKFTNDDMLGVIDVNRYINTEDLSVFEPIPPALLYDAELEYKCITSACGYYIKTEDGVIPVVVITWIFKDVNTRAYEHMYLTNSVCFNLKDLSVIDMGRFYTLMTN